MNRVSNAPFCFFPVYDSDDARGKTDEGTEQWFQRLSLEYCKPLDCKIDLLKSHYGLFMVQKHRINFKTINTPTESTTSAVAYC